MMRQPSGKRKKPVEMQLACGWRDCQEICNGEWQLNSHIAVHLEEHERQYHQQQQQQQEDADTDDEDVECVCVWGDCDFRTKCREEFERHCYYHGYYMNLLMQGKKECDLHPEIPACFAPIRDGEKLPELKSNFHCGWSDCNRSFVSIVEFQDHIVQHASFEYEIQKSPDDERPKTQCNWNLCHKQLENKYRLIEHICTHSNKKHVACFHCGELFRTKTTLFDHLRRQPDNNSEYNRKLFGKFRSLIDIFHYSFSRSPEIPMRTVLQILCHGKTVAWSCCAARELLQVHNVRHDLQLGQFANDAHPVSPSKG